MNAFQSMRTVPELVPTLWTVMVVSLPEVSTGWPQSGPGVPGGGVRVGV